MPPRCCSLLQLHVAIDKLSENDVQAYRAKFEEWLTRDKIYCPSPTCSAFISERTILLAKDPPDMALQTLLKELLEAVTAFPYARFFKSPPPYAQTPSYTKVVTQHMDLGLMKTRLSTYMSVQEMTSDIQLIVSNATKFHKTTHRGKEHPIALTAHQLLQIYMIELSNIATKLVAEAGGAKPLDHFVCSACHIAICTTCKQVEHAGKPCDTTLHDSEIAMLAQYHYKRCPLCKHAVKKMYGCSHMQCLCGAHWCYYCVRPFSECYGACEENVDSEDEENDENSEEEHDLANFNQSEATGTADAMMTNGADDTLTAIQKPQTRLARNESAARQVNDKIVNLDRGGSEEWADAGLDFGDEPDDDDREQIWFCTHSFEKFIPDDDEYNHGNLTRMECNKCFCHVMPWKEEPPSPKLLTKKRTSMGCFKPVTKTSKPAMSDAPDTELFVSPLLAWECKWCNIVLCEVCRSKAKAEASQ
jgi:hypothetical protein